LPAHKTAIGHFAGKLTATKCGDLRHGPELHSARTGI